MKYYKSDLWNKMQNVSTNQCAMEQWNINNMQYVEYFDSIKKYLPKKFIKSFDSANRFHDYIIDEINIRTITRKALSNTTNVIITLKNDGETYNMELGDVSVSKINIIDKSYCICNRMSWGYSEFELLENNKFKLSVLFDIVNELEFVFSKISIYKS